MKFQSLLFTMLVAVLSFAQVPTITSLSTYSAKAGTSLTITGSGFSTTASNNTVFFGGIKATVTAATASSLTVTVPKANSSCIVKVVNTASNLSSNEKPFVVKHTNTGSLVFGFATNNFGTQANVTSSLKAGTYGAGLNWKIADFNNDGLGDFIFIKNDNTICIYLNPGANSSFSLSGVTPLSISPSTAGNVSDFDVADFNNDGKMDFVIAQNIVNNGHGAAQIFKNNGDNTFSSYATINFNNLSYYGGWIPGDSQTLRICAGDVDNDGRTDIFASSQTMYVYSPLAVFRQTTIAATGTFSNYFQPASTGNYYPVTQAGLADFNNDGYLDAYYGINPIRYYLGGASGFSSTESTIAFDAGYSMNKAVRTDLNNDGNFDNLFANASSVANLNFVSGSMAATAVTTNMKEYCDVIDQDNDGDIDLVSAAGWWGGNGIRGSEKGASSFNTQISFSAFDDVRMGQSYLIDLNGDEYLDVIAPYLDGTKIVYSFFVGNPVPPTITANPSNSTLSYCVGSTATVLSITATGATSYKWQSSPNNSTWTDVAGATSASYTPSTASASALYYRGVAINSFGSTNSAATGLITVNALPTLTTNPTTTLDQYCYNYNSTTAITVATSASTPSYQWQVSSNNSTFANVTSTNGSGGTTASFVPSHVDIWYGGTKYYRCLVTSNGCSTTSNSKPFGVYADLTWTNPSNAAQNICINGTSTALSMTATGPNVVYSWQKSPNGSSSWTSISGANTNTYTPPTNIAGVNYYRCYISGTCSNTATASSGAITVTDTYTWTGATSTDPTVASNWSPAAVPCSGANEVIPTGLTNYPAYANLTIASGTTLTVQSGGRLTVTGTLTNDGTLTIESGATFLQGTSLAGTGTYNVKQTVTGAGGATPTGRFWYMGLPINNLTRAAAFGAASGSNRLWSWSESGQVWSSQITDATTLTPTTGYVFRTGATSTTLNFSGTSLYSANASITGLTNSGGTFDGCHLMSNPYTAYLDWEAIVADAGTTNLASTYCVRSFNSTSSEMVYDTYNATGDVAVNPSGVAMTRYIAPMQSFWITVNPSTTGTLSMTKAMLTHQAGAVGLKDITSFPAFARLNLVSGNFYDQVVVYTDANANAELENYDSKKFFLPNKAQVYCQVGNEKLVINALKQGKAQTSAPLTVELPSTQVYKFEMAESFVENGLVILEDKQEGIFQDMGVNPVYEFYGNSGVIADRFVLHFQLPNGTNNEGQAGIEDLTSGQIAVIANHNGAVTVALSADLTTSGDIQIFDEAGRLVAQKAITSAQTSLQLNNGMGVYFVRVQTPMKTEMKKVMVY